MKRMHKTIILSAFVALFLPVMAQATPTLTVTFNPVVQSVLPGGSLTFNGTLTVQGVTDPIYLYGDSITSSPGFGIVGFDTPAPDLIMLDDFPFLIGFPSFMSSDGSNGPSTLTFDFFTASVGSLVSPGTYLGSIDVIGAYDLVSPAGVLASAPFEIDVLSPVSAPEPASITLLFAGIAVTGLGVRRLRKLNVLS